MARRCVNKYSHWPKVKPKGVYARQQLPDSCFLYPERKKFPICSKDGCLSCSGLQAAYRRLIMLKGKTGYPPAKVEQLKRRVVAEALKRADESDTRNYCNFAIRAAGTVMEHKRRLRKKQRK